MFGAREKRRGSVLLLLAPVVYLLAAVVVVALVCRNGVYPSGWDTMYHVYRGDMLYRSILEGNWWPGYEPMWYNGVELLRYWAPLQAYVMALCQALAGGSAMYGYLVYVGLVCFLGGLAWLYVGERTGRLWLGAVIGLLWFFMPNNLYALFLEGNLARSLCMVFLPLFIYGLNTYLEKRTWSSLPLVTVTFSLMVMCHLGYGGMIALAVLLYLLVYRFASGRKQGIWELIIAILLGFAVLGLWLYPSLRGGITSKDNSETMSNFFQSILITLNPLDRYENDNGNFYFGLAAFILALLGGFCSHKKSAPGFWTGIIILICTTDSMYPVMDALPGGQYLWMLRFISIALCMILYSFLMWDTLRKPLVVLLVAALCLDTIPSLSMLYYNQSGVTAEQRMDEMQEYRLIKRGQELTQQRLALMDLSSMGATGAWLVSGWGEHPVAGTFGAGWEAANTTTNIVQINRAVENGHYRYLFDRCMELGNDTVIIQESQLNQETAPIEHLDAAAAQVGYNLIEASGGFRLYHLDVEGKWGTVTDYRVVGIGSMAPLISLQFPAMEETDSTNLNDYTFEELSQYDLIYLAGFTYDEREYAEDLILRLSEAGVHIVISADGIPEDRRSHDQSFLGVRCNAVSFSNGYPELDTIDGVLNTDLFPQDHTEWDTVYVEGLDKCWGTVMANDLLLDFYGTVKNDDIVIIALNLTYFLGLTKDPSVSMLLSHAMQLSPTELPVRTIVPLQVEQNRDSIVIVSPEDHVNTALAYHDIFDSDQELQVHNRLTFVDEGTTVIRLRYPYFYTGLTISAASILATAARWIVRKKRLRPKAKTLLQEVEEERQRVGAQ